jgi:hypothetical protein
MLPLRPGKVAFAGAAMTTVAATTSKARVKRATHVKHTRYARSSGVGYEAELLRRQASACTPARKAMLDAYT